MKKKSPGLVKIIYPIFAKIIPTELICGNSPKYLPLHPPLYSVGQ